MARASGTASFMEGIRGRDWLIATALGLVAACLMNYPAIAHFGSGLPTSSGDPATEAWSLAWIGHALRTAPGQLYDGNVFYPLPDALARSDMLLGFAPFALFARGASGLPTVYTVVFVCSYVLAFVGVYLLVRELGLSRFAAIAGGLAFAYAPWRLSQQDHLHVLSSGGIPLCLFLLVRGYRKPSRGLVIAGWLVAAWQVSVGFAVGLPLLYLLAALALVVAASSRLRGMTTAPRLLPATVIGAGVLAIVTLMLAAPHARVLASEPSPPAAAARYYSAPPAGVLVGSRKSELWGWRMVSQRESLSAPEEQALFPGVAIAGLALAGMAAGPLSRRLRVGLALGTLWLYVLSFGYGIAGGWLGYRLLAALPGWEGIRVPGRLMTLTTLGLALLTAAGAHALQRWTAQRQSSRRAWTGALVATSLATIAAEGYGPIPAGPVPKLPSAEARAPAPILQLPARFYLDPIYMYWSATNGLPPMVNGQATVLPPYTFHVYSAAMSFPDRRSVAYLRALGIRSVILHPRLTLLTPWKDAERKPIRGLGVARYRVGDDFVYRLGGPR